MTDEVRTRDDDGAWIYVEDGGIEAVAASAEVGAEEGGRGGGEGAATDGVRKHDVGWAWMDDNKPASAASVYSTVAPEFVVRRGGGGGVTDGVRKRDDGWAGMGDKKPAGDPKSCKTSFSCATSN